MSRKYQVTDWCHRFIKEGIKAGDVCIDATAGNGNDTEFLCQLTGTKGKVYAFDIQETALLQTERRLRAAGYQATLILAGHEHMEEYVEAGDVSCIVFNFGYLPGGDHQLATRPETSVSAIAAGLRVLKKDGIMSLCIYSGGDSGFAEREAILSFLKALDPRHYLVIVSEYYNRQKHPPLPVFITKLI